MANFTDEELGIFYKLWRRKCFGKGHMLIDNVVDGFPTKIQNTARDGVQSLIKKGYLGQKPTKHGMAVYINLDFKKVIYKDIKKKYPFV